MTEQLKNLMHEHASAPHFDPVDVATLVGEGDRRVRRRRLGTAVGTAVAGAAAVAVLATATTLAVGPEKEAAPVVDTPAAAERQLTWSVGSTIYTDGTGLETGRDVNAFVQTSLGFIMADDEGIVFSVQDGDLTEIGRLDAKHPRLVTDPNGSIAGWVEVVDEQPGFMVHDQETGETTRYDDATVPGMGTLADVADPAFFYAIDGDTAYWRDQRGAVAVDLGTGDVRVVDAEALNGFDIAAVRGSLIAFSGQGTTIATSRTDDGLHLPEAYGSTGVFSPDLAHYTSEGDEPSVWELETGERVALELNDYAFAVGYDWLDADTLAVVGMRNQKAPFELLTCAVPEGSCTAEVELPDGNPGEFGLPVGQGNG